jgi:hypothetical protein
MTFIASVLVVCRVFSVWFEYPEFAAAVSGDANGFLFV